MASSSWKIDSISRDYQLTQTGVPQQDQTLGTPALIRLATPRGRWLHAPDAQYGSTLHTLNRRVASAAEFINASQSALQPLVDQNRAQSVSVTLTGSARGDLRSQVRIVDEEGAPQIFNFTPIVGG